VASRRLPTVLALAVSRKPAGRPKVAQEVRESIRRIKAENPTWGAPRIHGELLLLGFEISGPTVSRYLQGLKRFPQESKAKQWLAFLTIIVK
jgi:putative transposase